MRRGWWSTTRRAGSRCAGFGFGSLFTHTGVVFGRNRMHVLGCVDNKKSVRIMRRTGSGCFAGVVDNEESMEQVHFLAGEGALFRSR